MAIGNREIPIIFDPPHHLQHCEPQGRLPRVQEAPALWQFLIAAHTILGRVPSQATLVGNPDITVNLRTVADSVALSYGVTIEQMFNPGLLGLAKIEAIRSGLEWDDRLNAWFDSAGKSYNIVTRDPDKLNQ